MLQKATRREPARTEDLTRPAWAAYGTSLLYLALLFAAMALDTLVRSP